MANWGRRKGTAGDKPDFKFLDSANAVVTNRVKRETIVSFGA